jgi:alpha-beta hydrolase superfamily lysophospholipase
VKGQERSRAILAPPRLVAGVVLVCAALTLESAGQPRSAPPAAVRVVTFQSRDGTTLSGRYLESAERPAPGVVLVHMLARSSADWTDLAVELDAAGISTLAVDLRGHGASGGAASDLPAMAGDVSAAVQWLSSRPTVRRDRLGVAGVSLGANLALLAAGDEPLVGAVAAVSPSLDYRGVRVGVDLMKKLGNRRVWFAASTEDPLALRTIRDLSLAIPDTADRQLSPEPAHGARLLQADRALARALVDWLRQRLLF